MSGTTKLPVTDDESAAYEKERYKARKNRIAEPDEIAFGVICLVLIIAIFCYQHLM